ncbi:MAG: hypothetical protein ABI806_18520, partial [Candidatus Solibacter sp.]
GDGDNQRLLEGQNSVFDLPVVSGEIAAFRQDAAHFLSREWQHDLDFSDASFARIQEWAAGQPDAAQLSAPANLGALPTQGCKAFQWHGHAAAMVDFVAGPDGEAIHLVSVDRRALPAPSVGGLAVGETRTGRLPPWNTAMWNDGRRIYVALTSASPEQLQHWIGNDVP